MASLLDGYSSWIFSTFSLLRFRTELSPPNLGISLPRRITDSSSLLVLVPKVSTWGQEQIFKGSFFS